MNDRESGELLKDVHQLTLLGITGFVYPKCTNGQDIYFTKNNAFRLDVRKRFGSHQTGAKTKKVRIKTH